MDLRKKLLHLLIFLSVFILLPLTIVNAYGHAGWWADGQIDDETFVQGMQFLVQNRILHIKLET